VNDERRIILLPIAVFKLFWDAYGRINHHIGHGTGG
jgi:hypothetical protein